MKRKERGFPSVGAMDSATGKQPFCRQKVRGRRKEGKAKRPAFFRLSRFSGRPDNGVTKKQRGGGAVAVHLLMGDEEKVKFGTSEEKN